MTGWRHIFRLIGAALLGGAALLARAPTSLAEDPARLWRIERPGLPPSHLFGTMHSDDPRVTALPAQVTTALAAAPRLAVEMKLDAKAERALATASLRGAGRSAAEALDEAHRNRARAILSERHLPAELLDVLKPWALFLTFSQPPMGGGAVLDSRLQDQARARGQTIISLETVDEQIDLFDGMTPDTQAALLASAIDDHDDLAKTVETMTVAYLGGDLDRLKVISDQPAPGLDAETQGAIDRRMIDERNHRMAERLTDPLAQGGVFVAVGALHLPGPEGLIELLRRRGWRVIPAD